MLSLGAGRGAIPLQVIGGSTIGFGLASVAASALAPIGLSSDLFRFEKRRYVDILSQHYKKLGFTVAAPHDCRMGPFEESTFFKAIYEVLGKTSEQELIDEMDQFIQAHSDKVRALYEESQKCLQFTNLSFDDFKKVLTKTTDNDNILYQTYITDARAMILAAMHTEIKIRLHEVAIQSPAGQEPGHEQATDYWDGRIWQFDEVREHGQGDLEVNLIIGHYRHKIRWMDSPLEGFIQPILLTKPVDLITF